MHVYRNLNVLGDGSVNFDSKDQLGQISKINLCVPKKTAEQKNYWPYIVYDSKAEKDPNGVSVAFFGRSDFQHFYKFKLDAADSYGLSNTNVNVPTTIPRFADIDKDGHEDLILTASKKGDTVSRTLVFVNMECPQDIYT